MAKKLYSTIDKREEQAQLASVEDDVKVLRQKRKALKAKEVPILPATNEELLNIRVEQLLRFDRQSGRIPESTMNRHKHKQRLRSTKNEGIRVGNSRSSSSMIKEKIVKTATKATKRRKEKARKAKSIRDLAKKLKKELKK